MKQTDYSQIAPSYEKNLFRLNVPPDNDLLDFIYRSPCSSFQVLDLACGTGIYLRKQINFFKHVDIAWHGLDASEDMLNIAKEKIADASLLKGLAECLPYESASFDFIVSNYAFHHFVKKQEVLNEITRTLKQHGVCKIHNISIQDMPKWWVFQYFPSAYEKDLQRFWPKERLFNELAGRDFTVEARMEYKMKEEKVADLIHYAQNKDISSLNLVDEHEYRQGLERMEHALKKDPAIKVVNELAEIFFLAKKK